MKKILLLNFAVFSFYFLPQSQNNTKYHPMLRENVYWDVIHFDEAASICGYNGGLRYYINGVKDIDGTEWKILKIDIIGSYSGPFKSPCPPYKAYRSNYDQEIYVREDTIKQRIYLYENQQEILLYDFSLKPGDTLFRNDGASPELILQSIEPIRLFNGEIRNKYNFYPVWSEEDNYIEGIGSNYGLIDPFLNFEGTTKLYCVKENNIPVWGEVCNIYYDDFARDIFPDSNAIWSTIVFNNAYDPETGLGREITRYGLVGDTIIYDKEYSKLYILNDTTLNIDDKDEYFGAIREDSLKVFVRFKELPDEDVLLYYFSPYGNETVWYNYKLKGTELIQEKHYKTVNKCQFSCDHDKWIDKYSAHSSYKSTNWIEQAGCLDGYGLFNPLMDSPEDEDKVYASCFKWNGKTIYQNNPICGRCFCSTVSNDEITKDQEPGIELTQGENRKIIIRLPENLYNVNTIYIMDMEGKIVEHVNSITTNNIKSRSLIPGMYLVMVKSETESKPEIRKIIVR